MKVNDRINMLSVMNYVRKLLENVKSNEVAELTLGGKHSDTGILIFGKMKAYWRDTNDEGRHDMRVWDETPDDLFINLMTSNTYGFSLVKVKDRDKACFQAAKKVVEMVKYYLKQLSRQKKEKK
jgi:hypothetical protein